MWSNQTVTRKFVTYQSGCGNEDRWPVGGHLIEADPSRRIPVNQPIVCSTSKWNVELNRHTCRAETFRTFLELFTGQWKGSSPEIQCATFHRSMDGDEPLTAEKSGRSNTSSKLYGCSLSQTVDCTCQSIYSTFSTLTTTMLMPQVHFKSQWTRESVTPKSTKMSKHQRWCFWTHSQVAHDIL